MEFPGLHIVFDAADPERLSRFWLAAMPGYEYPGGPPDGFATWDEFADAHGIPAELRNRSRTLVDTAGRRPDIFFNQVPEPAAGKNRLHLDIKVARGLEGAERRARIVSEATRIETAGGTIAERVDGPDGFWIVMQDIEGNVFCVI